MSLQYRGRMENRGSGKRAWNTVVVLGEGLEYRVRVGDPGIQGTGRRAWNKGVGVGEQGTQGQESLEYRGQDRHLNEKSACSKL